MKLSPKQVNALRHYVKKFDSYLKSNSFSNDLSDREQRVSFYHEELPDKIEDISEIELEEIISNLWASRMWGNKQYLVQKIINENGLGSIKYEIKRLLDTSIPASERYYRALNKINGLGPASITEMLTYIQPEECGIWNRKARDALKILGIEHVNPDKYRLSANEYAIFNQLMLEILNELKNAGISTDYAMDLIFVDFFLFVVSQGLPTVIYNGPIFDHDEIRDLTENIGVMLGFETDTEVNVAHGARVDVVWRTRIGNLGMVTYVFEVHKSGSIDSLLLNLQKAKSNPTVQKVIAISDEAQLKKIEKECEGLPEGFKRDLTFWQVKHVQEVAEKLQSSMEIINSLDLIRGTF